MGRNVIYIGCKKVVARTVVLWCSLLSRDNTVRMSESCRLYPTERDGMSSLSPRSKNFEESIAALSVLDILICRKY